VFYHAYFTYIQASNQAKRVQNQQKGKKAPKLKKKQVQKYEEMGTSFPHQKYEQVSQLQTQHKATKYMHTCDITNKHKTKRH